jgi:hypothetical protein
MINLTNTLHSDFGKWFDRGERLYSGCIVMRS